MVWIAACAIWIVCGVWAYGLTFGYFQGKWPNIAKGFESLHRRLALTIAVGGPLGVGFALWEGGTKYGLKFRSSERNERCEK